MAQKIHLIVALMTLLAGVACQQNKPKPMPEQQTSASSDALPWASDRDLVCEMKIDQTAEDTLHYAGKVYGFCSAHCKETFKENPAKYAGK